MEELRVRPDGTRLTLNASTYRLPKAYDTPSQFNVKLLKGSSNPMAIFSSKAVGEPPLFLGSSAFFAIREAVRAYKLDNGFPGGYFRFDSPATKERVRLACEDSIMKRVPDGMEGGGGKAEWTVEL